MNQEEWEVAQQADQQQRESYIADLLANRIPAGGLDGIESVGPRDSAHQRWTDEDVARFATMIYGMPEDSIDEGLYWDNAMQATAMLMASLYVLARELNDNHESCDGGRPALVEHIVRMAISKAPLLRAKVVEALL